MSSDSYSIPRVCLAQRGKRSLFIRSLTSGQAPTGSIVFAISPSSASCERVFSLLKLMFNEQQISSLADAIRAALMLRYNDRIVG